MANRDLPLPEGENWRNRHASCSGKRAVNLRRIESPPEKSFSSSRAPGSPKPDRRRQGLRRDLASGDRRCSCGGRRQLERPPRELPDLLPRSQRAVAERREYSLLREHESSRLNCCQASMDRRDASLTPKPSLNGGIGESGSRGVVAAHAVDTAARRS